MNKYQQFQQMAQWKGVTLLLYPSGEFGNQELQTNAEVKEFIGQYGLVGKPNVIIMSKGLVLGPNARDSWKFMKAACSAPDPTWNFGAVFLVSKTGKVEQGGVNYETRIQQLLQE